MITHDLKGTGTKMETTDQTSMPSSPEKSEMDLHCPPSQHPVCQLPVRTMELSYLPDSIPY